MTVAREITRLEHSSVKLTLTVPQGDVLTEYNALLAEYAKNFQVPGFRKGKAPREVLERKLGEAVKEEGRRRVMEAAVKQVLEDESFPRGDLPLPYSPQEVEGDPPFDLDKDFPFSVTYDVFPVVPSPVWQGLEAEYLEVVAGDEDLNRELEALRERNAIVRDKDEGDSALPGDVVTVTYAELGEDGAVLPGTERQDFVFVLGSGTNYYKIDKDIEGMKKGETREFEKTFGSGEGVPGAPAGAARKKLRVTLTGLKTRELPALDDDLAQDVDEKFATLEDLKTVIRERLAAEAGRRTREMKVSRILEKILTTAPVDLPRSMINLELESRWRNMARYFNTTSEELYARMGGDAPGGARSIIDGWTPDTVQALHARLVVERLMEDLVIEAGEEDIAGEIAKQAGVAGVSLEDLRKYYEGGKERMEALKEEIRERKLFDLLLEKNTLKPGGSIPYADLAGRPSGE